MPAYQTNYTEDWAIGLPGMMATGERFNGITRSIETAGGIGFGKPAFRGTGDRGIATTGTAPTFLGVTLGTYAPQPQADGSYIDSYPQRANVPVLTSGSIWVVPAVNVADGDQAYATPAGALTNVATGNVIMTDWFFDTTAAAGGLARLVKR